MSGKEELIRVSDEIKQISEMGLCDDATMFVVGKASMALLRTFSSTEVSREEASRILGVSTRTLSRLVEQGEIEPPRRRGFRKKAYSRASIEAYLSRKKA